MFPTDLTRSHGQHTGQHCRGQDISRNCVIVRACKSDDSLNIIMRIYNAKALSKKYRWENVHLTMAWARKPSSRSL